MLARSRLRRLLAILVAAFLISVSPACSSLPSDAVIQIDFYSSSTKEDWINAVTETFNAAHIQTADGKPILVRVTHVNSGGSQLDILAGSIKPTVWSPGDYSWVDGVNRNWAQASNGQLLISQACEATVYEPTGFAMWRPMAEALGWPNKPIGWPEIIALASDPQGWARYGHPEWGAFRFGHTLPEYSNSGRLILAALAYSSLGLTESVTAQQIRSDPVFRQAMRELELHTTSYGVQSELLVQQMVLRGPDYLHAINTNEAEVLKSNVRYGNLLPFQLAFIIPAGGTFWAEHPICVLDTDWVTDEQRAAARLYIEYLLEPEQQELAVDKGLRPANSTVHLRAPIALENGTDPRVTPEIVPSLAGLSTDAADAILEAFHLAKEVSVIVALDKSGSLTGDEFARVTEVVQGLLKLLSPNDEVLVYAFDNTAVALQPLGQVEDVADSLSQTLQGLRAEGDAAMFDTICLAVQQGAKLQADPIALGDQRLYAVVLLSGGPDSASQRSEADLFKCLPSAKGLDGIRVFTIDYSKDATHQELLRRIAEQTGGAAFTAHPDIDDDVYKAIYVEQ